MKRLTYRSQGSWFSAVVKHLVPLVDQCPPSQQLWCKGEQHALVCDAVRGGGQPEQQTERLRDPCTSFNDPSAKGPTEGTRRKRKQKAHWPIF